MMMQRCFSGNTKLTHFSLFHRSSSSFNSSISLVSSSRFWRLSSQRLALNLFPRENGRIGNVATFSSQPQMEEVKPERFKNATGYEMKTKRKNFLIKRPN